MAITLTGLASGLDTETIVAQLMAIEQNKVTAVQRRQTSITQHKTDLGTIKTKLDAVKTAAQDLTSSATWKATQATTSSDPTKVDVQILGGAGIGGQSIKVDRLASSAQRGFTFTPNADTAGKLTLAYDEPDGTAPVTIDVPANATVTDVATAINANEKSPVYAAVVKDGGVDYLVLSSRKPGSKSDFTVDTSQMASAAQLQSSGDKFKRLDNLDAEYWIGDDFHTSESNVIENAVPGVRLTLKGVTSSPVSVNTTAAAIDTDGIVKKITALVDAYNGLVTATRSEITEKRVPTATSTSDLQKGQLFGDSGMSSMLNALKLAFVQPLKYDDPAKVDDPVDFALTSLAALGIGAPKASGGSSSEDAKAGKLVIDTEKLKSVLAADHTKVRELFAGNAEVKGLSAVISDYVGTQTGSQGTLTGRIESDNTRLTNFTKHIDKLNERMAAEEKRLKAQFAAMEAALNSSQTQQAWLTSQIATLPSYY